MKQAAKGLHRPRFKPASRTGPQQDAAGPRIGALLRERRAFHDWTLAEVSRRTGLANSTLSKIENDRVVPSYRTIMRLCRGLEIEIGDIVAAENGASPPRAITGRRSVSRDHAGQVLGDDRYTYTYLCGDVAHKRIIPIVVDVHAEAMEEIEGLWSHVGEEFIYVLSGCLVLHTEFYEPLELGPGDSAYIDSTMGHAFLRTGATPVRILVLCSSATPNLAQTLRDVLVERLRGEGGNATD